jgi:uncharacterized membrane protein HdeD (DUF308 family)
MPILLARNWWSLVIRGFIAILFGLVTFAWPGITLSALVLLFGAYALMDGIVIIVGIFRGSNAHERWGVLLIEGIAGIAAGLVTFFWPLITTLALVYVVAVWALVTGVFEIAAAIRLRKEIRNEWLLALAGVVSVILGVLLVIAPVVGALALTLWIGAYAIVFGALLVALGLRLRSRGHTLGTGASMPLPAR